MEAGRDNVVAELHRMILRLGIQRDSKQFVWVGRCGHARHVVGCLSPDRAHASWHARMSNHVPAAPHPSGISHA
jgi:hypothetical protein